MRTSFPGYSGKISNYRRQDSRKPFPIMAEMLDPLHKFRLPYWILYIFSAIDIHKYS
jgi:hypothetical protein